MTPDLIESWQSLIQCLSEAQRRWYAAQKALEQGRGGIEFVHKITGFSRQTISRGIRELKRGEPYKYDERSRRQGGGRKTLEGKDPRVLFRLREIMDENTAGDPMSALMYTHKSTTTLAQQLQSDGFEISPDTVGRLLREDNYSLQANAKSKEGNQHKERDSQFKYINEQAATFMAKEWPVISVDAKKRELVGDFKNPGKTWRPKGNPLHTGAYDFLSLAVGPAYPYGCYDALHNEGFVNVGVSADTAEFAVQSIDLWWKRMGKKRYPNPKAILICADGGGSNSSRAKLWKISLQSFATRHQLVVMVSHYPPGTSKWNKIEHRLFSFISMNWAGKPLYNYATVVNLITNTTTRKGLKVKAQIDKRTYKKGIKVTSDEMDDVLLARHSKHPEWNYTIFPQPAVN